MRTPRRVGTTLHLASLVLPIAALAVSACDDVDESLDADIQAAEHRCKFDDKPGVSFDECKDIADSAQQFFQGMPVGDEREVFAIELKTRIDTATPTVIIDVRPVAEFSAGHIPGALNVPLDALFDQGICRHGTNHQCDGRGDRDDRNCKAFVLPTDGTPIVLVSGNGHAASLAVGVLGSIGYNVYALRFGMIGWVKSSDVQIQRADRTQRIQGLGGELEL